MERGSEARLSAGEPVSRAACQKTFDDAVGDPPAERLERGSSAARRGCGALSQDGWHGAQWDVVRAIRDAHGEVAAPRYQRAFSEIAGAVAGTRADVYCWPPRSSGRPLPSSTRSSAAMKRSG